MPLIFTDSWDHYNTNNPKWDVPGGDVAIDLSGTLSRTGIGCLNILSGNIGPAKFFQQRTQVLAGSAFFLSGGGGDLFWFMYGATAAQNVRIHVQLDGSIQALVGNDGGVAVTLLGTSAVGVVQFGAYNYIEAKVLCAAAPNGLVVVRVNNVEVLNVSGVKTYAQPIDGGQPFISELALRCPGGLARTVYIDDTYILDWSAAPNNDFLGPVKIFCGVPDADVAVSWTPNPGPTNFSNVDEIPPDGDTTYNASDTVGQSDQYRHPVSGIPALSSVFGVQHCLELRTDGSARSVGSEVEGVVGSDNPLTATYRIYSQPYDVNPLTTLPWDMGDLPITAGPSVTA